MSQQAVQLTVSERISGTAALESIPGPADGDTRFSEIRALSSVRVSGSELRPLWLESACLGSVLSLTLASYLLLDLDLGPGGNLSASLTCSALSCATIATGLSRARRLHVLCLLLVSLAAALLVWIWFAFAPSADSGEAPPARAASSQ